MTGYRHRYPRYGTLGLVVLLLMETAIFCGQSPKLSGFPWWRITVWATPVCWWAYILAVDAWIYHRKGTSLLMDRRRIFVLQCILSVAFWCLFEAYNRVMPGWRYENLETDLSVRLLGLRVVLCDDHAGPVFDMRTLQSFGVFARARMPFYSMESRRR